MVPSLLAAAVLPASGVPGGFGFSYLPGPHGAPYLGSTEGDFTLTTPSGSWQQSLIYGNPGGSIFVGPLGAPAPAALNVTDSAGRFNFISLDYSSNNGESLFDIQGFLGANLLFHETGTLTASYSPFSFHTLLSNNPGMELDGLIIQLLPGPGATSINIDNIFLVTVPEPGTAGLAAVIALVTFGRRFLGVGRDRAAS
jgi:hypothetical protein